MDVVTSHPFSLEGRVKSYENADDLKEDLKPFEEMTTCDLIKLSGNTFGVEGCRAFANALKKRSDLIVSISLL